MEYRSVDKLKAHPINIQLYGEEELPPDFLASVQEKGILEPLAIKQDCTIISGHRRWRAAKAANMETIPVVIVEYDNELDEREAIIDFNRQREKTFSQRMAEAEELDAIESERTEIERRKKISNYRKTGETVEIFPQSKTRDKVAEQTGMGSGRTYDKAKKVWEAAKSGDEEAKKEIQKIDRGESSISGAHKKIVKKEKREKQEEATEKTERLKQAKTNKKIEVKQGEWWQLGRHFLYCGDTSKAEFFDNIPNGELAFADPPYNANVAEWDEGFEWEHDWLINKAKIVTVTPGIESLFDFAKTTKMPYQWSISCWLDNGMTRGKMGFGNWIYIAVFSEKSIHRNSQDFLRISIQGENRDHKGQKPAKLITWLIDTFTSEGDIVIDPFLGSGTTLYAAENMDRRCIAGEIRPDYCSDVISRWQHSTGGKAVRVHGQNII